MRNLSVWKLNEPRMSELHQAYLSLGSNIQPEINLVKAVQFLQQRGDLKRISNAWETKSVGAEGPNYLNACILLLTALSPGLLKEKVIRPIELQLGRKKSANKFAPRTIDIDIVLFDDLSYDERSWEKAYVVIPLAEIYPTYLNRLRNETIHEAAARLRSETWMHMRPEVMLQVGGSNLPPQI